MSDIPNDLRYTRSHEWLRSLPNGQVEVGITHHAQSSLGDLVFVDLPQAGRAVSAGEACAVVESVKAASDIYSPVDGVIVAGNAAVAAAPELVNSDPYGRGLADAHRAARRRGARRAAERGRIRATAGRRQPLAAAMPFIPHTREDVAEMLRVIGVGSIDELFEEIPPALHAGPLSGVPAALSEMEIGRLMSERAATDGRPLCFIGAGAYEHHIPAPVWAIATRGEFYSAYTPYQAEASQGTLQLIYEYQSMLSALTGMEVSNASLYDGASALAEACLMAVRANRASQSRAHPGSARRQSGLPAGGALDRRQPGG